MMVEDNGKNYNTDTRTKAKYSVEGQRQVLQALRTLQSQLNFSYENDIKNDARLI